MTNNYKSNVKVSVFDPTAGATEIQEDLARRFNGLNGKVVGFLDNTKEFSDVIFAEVEERMKQMFPDVQVRHYRKESVKGVSPATMSQMKDECDAVVTGLGD